MVWIVRNTSSGRGSRAFSTPIRRSASASIDGMMPAVGLVTPTWIGAARGLEGVLTSGRGGGSPRPERFVS
jgi:hypothetical protein